MKKYINLLEAGLGMIVRAVLSFSLIFTFLILNNTLLMAQNGMDNGLLTAENNSGIHLSDNSMDYPVAVKLPGYINTSKMEEGPLVSPDGNTIFFSQVYHPFGMKGLLSYEEISYSTYDSRANIWTTPVMIGPPLTSNELNSINFIQVSKDTILFAIEYQKDGIIKEGISMSVREDGEFSFPFPVGIDFNSDLKGTPDLFFRHRGKAIVFSGDRNGSFGGKDLYVALLEPGDSIRVRNLGKAINTDADEITPFLAGDNSTLYFASKGHGGFGGFDIFVTHRLDDTWQHWSEPENLGPAINTDKDESYFNLSKNGNYAYFTRQVSGRNSDIFQVPMPVQQQARLNK